MRKGILVSSKLALVLFISLSTQIKPVFSSSRSGPPAPRPALGRTSTQTEEKAASIALPPMGWSSWNSFSNSVDSNVIIQETDALVASGMKQSGYQYINIDEGWWSGERDQNGSIIVNPVQWPALRPDERAGDMSNIVRYIHSAGLKAGIYTDAGESGCGFYGPDLGLPMPHTGSEGHYEQDFLQFAEWGFDYVKVDWCGGHKEDLDPATQYAAIAAAIKRAEKLTHHQLFYSICNWGNNSSWTWAPGIGGVSASMWRTSGDIVAPIVANGPNSDRKASFAGVLSNFDLGIHPMAQHTGYYNDPDMMVVGMQGLTESQNRAHMSLWAISAAPLIVGADLTKLDNTTKAILTNPAVIAIDHDPLGLQAIKVAESSPGLQVWTKPLATPGEHAVLLLNRTAVAGRIEVDWDNIGLEGSSEAFVTDAWSHRELGSYRGSYAATISAGDAALLVIRGVDSKPSQYEATSTEDGLSGKEEKKTQTSHSDENEICTGTEKKLTFKTGLIRSATFARIFYANGDDHPVIGKLSFDGGIGTHLLFPPTQGAERFIAIVIEPKRAENESTLSISMPLDKNLTVFSLAVFDGLHK